MPTVARAQDAEGILRDYTINSWAQKDGIVGRIFAIAQTPDEYLWVGTDAGLLRFDGVKFVPWTEISSQPLASRRVLTMCVGRDGSLWVGFTNPGGISRIKNGTVINYDRSYGLTGDPVENLTEDRDGAIWASTRGGLFRFSEEKWERVHGDGGFSDGPVSSTFADSRGNLWVSTPEGVFRRLRGHTKFERVMPASYWSHRVMEDRNKAIWITDPRVGAVRLFDNADAEAPTVTDIAHPPGTEALGVLEAGEQDALGVQVLADSRGDLWIATLGRGVWRLRSSGRRSVLDTLTVDKGLQSDVIRALWEDHKKNIWVGTNSGLHQLSRRTITSLTNLGVIRVLERGADDSVWIGTRNGLVRLKNGRETRYTTPELPSAFVSALYADRRGTLWIVTDKGVTRFKDEQFHPLKIPSSQLTRVYSVATDAHGTLWLCDVNHGLFRWANDELTPFDVPGEVDHRTVTWVDADADERVWLHAAGALHSIEPGGKPRRVEWGNGAMGVYQETRGDAVWSYGANGVTRLEGDSFATIDQKNGLPATPVFWVLPTLDGNVWFATPVGILRVSEDVFRQVKGNPGITIAYTLYDTEDGMAGMPLGPNSSRTSDGRLWFRTLNGISIVDPRMTRDESAPPPVHIQNVLADARRVDARSHPRLPPNTATIELDYSAVTFSSPTKVRYRYRLEGFDREWQDAGTRREALYTNLPPGQYTFHVTAAHNERGFSSEGATLAFTLLPTFYQTWWFYAASAAAFALVLWAAWKQRVGHLQREFQLVLGERVRLSREIHDTLLQSLAGVALQLDALAESAPVGFMKDALATARREVEGYVRETRHSISNLRSPRLDHGGLAAALRATGERATAGTPVHFTLTTTGQARECEANIEQQLLRIGEQALLNSVRHADASQVHLALQFARDAVRMRVSDNGRGFDADEVMAQHGEHYGLISMQERAAQAGGQLNITTHPGGGTAVEVVIPVLSRH